MSSTKETHVDDLRASRTRPLLSIAILILAVIGIYFVVRAVPLDVLGDIRAKRLAWWSLPLIASLQIVFLFFVTEIWRRIVELTTETRITLWSSYFQLAAAGVGKYVPGKVWGFVARAGVMYGQRIPVYLSALSSVVEQMLLVIGALLVAIITALIALPSYWIAIMIVGISLLLAAIVACSKVPTITRWLLHRRKIEAIPDTISAFHFKRVFRFSLAYSVLWVLNGLIFSVIYYSLFDAPVTAQGVGALILANTVGIVLGFFAFFLPGGIGVREAIVTFILAGFVPVREALLAAVCYRAWMIFVDGVNALLILGREASTMKSERPQD
jgi:uncharacterized membrane protein YbhN (UPF0104 family)